LPVTFPRALDQLPRAKIEGVGATPDIVFDVHYDEGAAVGYRWFDKQRAEPLFPFGLGLSYTTFARRALSAKVENGELHVHFRVKNGGTRPGSDVAQVYVAPVGGGWESPKHLGAFAKTELAPGATRDVDVVVEPRLLAQWDSARAGFHVAAGKYRVTLASSARDSGQSVTVALEDRVLPAGSGARAHAP
jgi:beta-glucosidase